MDMKAVRGSGEDVPQVLMALRQATRQSHTAVERLTPFFSPDFDRHAYLRWLDLMHAFYRNVDKAVESASFASLTGWRYKARCKMIVADLAVLASRPPEEPADTGGILSRLADLRQTSEIAGMLYVVEGSALGGKVLLRVLDRSAGVTAEAGASFFAPHGHDPSACWAEYVKLLSKLAVIPKREQQVVDGAETTFSVLQDWIRQAWR